MSNPRSVLEDLSLTPVAGVEGRYSIHFHEGWKVLYVFGGFTFAAGVEAVCRELARPDLSPVSAQATYFAPVNDGPGAVHVEVIRSGKSGAQARATIWNAADPAADAAPAIAIDVVLGRHNPDLGQFQDLEMPADAGVPLDAAGRDQVQERWVEVPFHQQSDFRMVGGWGPHPDRRARSLSWFRLNESPIDETGAWRPGALGLPGDILGPAVGRALPDSRFFAVTLQLSIQWFAPARTEWILQHAQGIRGVNGFTTGTAELWTEDGKLAAFATQTALMRPFERVQSDGLQSSDTQG